MESDRDASGGGEIPSRPDSTSPAGSPSTAPASADSPASSPTQSSPGDESTRDYGYGQTPLEAAGTGGLRAADSGAEEPSPESGSPTTGIHPVTGMRTAPRAVLRPVPDGFPTPPPRPALPNRRPAPKQAAAPATSSRRGLLLAGITVAVILLLIIAVGGAVLAVRALTPADPATAGAPASHGDSSPASAGSGQVQIGEVSITEMSTEVGVRSVGDQGTSLEPAGEYIVVAFEVTNPSDLSVEIGDNVTLETADGQPYASDAPAGQAYVGEGKDFGVLPPGETGVFYKVYDVPIGSEPTALHFNFSVLDESGTLPLGG